MGDFGLQFYNYNSIKADVTQNWQRDAKHLDICLSVNVYSFPFSPLIIYPVSFPGYSSTLPVIDAIPLSQRAEDGFVSASLTLRCDVGLTRNYTIIEYHDL